MPRRSWSGWLAALAAVGMLPACAVRDPGYVATGQSVGRVTWLHGWGADQVEAVFQKDPDGFHRMLVFSENGPLRLTQTRDGWVITGKLAERGWRGQPEKAPEALGIWLSLAEAYPVTAGSHPEEGETRAQTERYSATYRWKEGRLVGMEVANPAGDERLRVLFL